MAESGGRLLFLTGAPLQNSLTWEEDRLSAILQPCFTENSQHPVGVASTAENHTPSWRSLPFEQPHLHTGLTQAGRQGWSLGRLTEVGDELPFLSGNHLSFVSGNSAADQSQGSLGSQSDKDEILSQYYEHSFALHEDIPSSQIIGAVSAVYDSSFVTGSEDFAVTFNADGVIDSKGHVARSRLTSTRLSDLKGLPSAAYLHSITPQTMTVNLVVGIISISQPRTIRTRQGRLVELVEMLVGDDTKAGFGINIWLPAEQKSNHSVPREGDLRNDTLQLRPRDIVLVRQVALSSFRGKVYGQSLRKGMTSLDLLYRIVVDKDDRTGAFGAKDLEEEAMIDSQILKTKKVNDWVIQFVGAIAGLPPLGSRSRSVLRKELRFDALPNDTP